MHSTGSLGGTPKAHMTSQDPGTRTLIRVCDPRAVARSVPQSPNNKSIMEKWIANLAAQGTLKSNSMLRPHSRPINSEFLGVGLRCSHFLKLPQMILMSSQGGNTTLEEVGLIPGRAQENIHPPRSKSSSTSKAQLKCYPKQTTSTEPLAMQGN